MRKTQALRSVVASTISSIVQQGTTVYYGQAREGAQGKYVVYTCEEVLRDYGKTAYEVEINLIDYGTDTSSIEDLADQIQEAFNKKVVVNEDISVSFYADRRNNVQEEDRLILRRRLTFAANLYDGKD